MNYPRLHNYLRTHRKRCGLSQAEVAFLVGCKSSSKISGYERRGRLPSLKTIFAFEAIYDAPAHALFAGLAGHVQQEVAARKRRLAGRWAAGQPQASTPMVEGQQPAKRLSAHHPNT